MNNYNCPKCDKGDVHGHAFDVEQNMVMQKMHCSDCDAEWYDVYHLAEQRLVSVGTVEVDDE